MEKHMYHPGMRQLQDLRETRRLADRLQEVLAHSEFTDEDRDFIQRSPMVFIATADAEGQPDCSYKGGMPGFIRVLDSKTLCLPDYDGNGMYRSWGNVLVNHRVGLLFIDFEQPGRLRVNGTASISPDDPLLESFEGAVFIIRIEAERIFANCPRYLHKMKLLEYSTYAPKPGHSPPVPAWKNFEEFHDYLPARDRDP